MKIGIHQKYWLFMLPLLWMQQPLCAENLSTVSRLYEFTLPQQSVDDSETGGQEMSPEEQEYRKEREILNQQSILSGERLALTPELIEIQQSVDALLQQPEDLTPLKYLQQHPEQLQAYIERQFYNGTDLNQQKTYIRLFALILGDKAVQPMIGWSHILKDHPVLLQSIIKGLTYLKPTIEIRQLIDALLDNELQHPDVIRSAIFYYSVWPDDSAMRWVIQFRNDHTPQNTRYLVFYLAALVGDDSILPRIVEMLEQQPPLYQRYYLQLALSHLVSKDHYQQLTSDMILDEVAAESIRRQMQFRHTSISERDELLEPMLSSYFFGRKANGF